MSKVFSEVLHIINGKNQRSVENPNGKYPIYGSGGIMGYADDYLCEAETVIIGRKGSINKPIYIEEPFWNVDTAFGLVADKTVLLPRYLFYFCVNYDFEKLNRTVTIPSLTKSDLLKVEINLPDIIFQQKVVERIDSVENCIKLYQIQLQKLDELIKSRFVEMFGTIHDNLYSYDIRFLQDVCEKIKDGTHQTPEYTIDTVHGYKFLSSKDVTSSYIDWSHVKYIPKHLHDELYSRIKPQKGDILLAKNGTTGIAAVVDTDDIFDIYVSLALLRPIETNSIYLWAAINMPESKEQFDVFLKGIGVPNLHLAEIKKCKIIIPPLKKQNQFADFVTQVEKQKATVQQSIDKLETLKKSLMQEYFG